MGRTAVSVFLLAIALCACADVVAGSLTREPATWLFRSRTFYLYVPGGAAPGKPAPLLLLLHGSGRDGMSLMKSWTGLAEREGVVLVAPDASNAEYWSVVTDGPDFLHSIIGQVASRHSIDPARMYVFGHSAGGVYALVLGLVESEYFASVAVHAAALLPGDYRYVDRARRNIPMAIFAGDRDNVFPPSLVRSARDALQARTIPLKLVEIRNHGHDYYGPAESINREVWEFLKTSKLPNAPRYEFYFFFQLM